MPNITHIALINESNASDNIQSNHLSCSQVKIKENNSEIKENKNQLSEDDKDFSQILITKDQKNNAIKKAALSSSSSFTTQFNTELLEEPNTKIVMDDLAKDLSSSHFKKIHHKNDEDHSQSSLFNSKELSNKKLSNITLSNRELSDKELSEVESKILFTNNQMVLLPAKEPINKLVTSQDKLANNEKTISINLGNNIKNNKANDSLASKLNIAPLAVSNLVEKDIKQTLEQNKLFVNNNNVSHLAKEMDLIKSSFKNDAMINGDAIENPKSQTFNLDVKANHKNEKRVLSGLPSLPSVNDKNISSQLSSNKVLTENIKHINSVNNQDKNTSFIYSSSNKENQHTYQFINVNHVEEVSHQYVKDVDVKHIEKENITAIKNTIENQLIANKNISADFKIKNNDQIMLNKTMSDNADLFMPSIEKETLMDNKIYQISVNQQGSNSAVKSELSPIQFNLRSAESQVSMNEMINRFTPAMKQQLISMINQGTHHAEIRLDPPELGQMMVRVQVSGEQAQLQFNVSLQQTRDLVEQAMPRLKEMLAESGMQLADSQVSQDQQQQSNKNTGFIDENNQIDNMPDQITESVAVTYPDLINKKGIDFYA